MNFYFGQSHLIYLGLLIVSLLVSISGFCILKNNLKLKETDILRLYGSILVILIAVLVFVYCFVKLL